jgi:hypothetical protein
MNEKQQLEQAKEDYQAAGYAQQVVNNPAYKQAMMVIRADLLQKFTSVSFKDTDELLEIKRRMDTIEQIQSLFERTMETGRVAEHKIGKLTKFLNKLRN